MLHLLQKEFSVIATYDNKSTNLMKSYLTALQHSAMSRKNNKTFK